MPGPAPSLVYLIPGLGGTDLWLDQALTQRLYINVNALVYGGLRLLWLDLTGYRPLPGVGKKCYPGTPVALLYGAPWAAVAQDPRLDGWSVFTWPYDWRLPLPYQGQLLALDILQRVTTDAPCTLVGHSNGGALARYAWAYLRNMNRDNLVRRMITLGTPHQGSYQALAGMIGQLSWLNQILVFQTALNALTTGPWVSSSIGPYSASEIGLIQQSWQAWYHLLPNPFGSAFSSDPFLARIFSQSIWPPWADVEDGVLAFCEQDLFPLAVDPANIPPPWVMTTIAGTGYSTPSQIARLPFQGKTGDLLNSTSGDGAVMVASALIAGSKQFTMSCAHVDLVAQTVAGGFLVDEILDPRGPPGPAPPPALQSVVLASGIIFPPLVPSVLQTSVPSPPPLSSGPDP